MKTVSKKMYAVKCACCEELMQLPMVHMPMMFADKKGLQRFLLENKIQAEDESELFDESRIVEVQVRYQIKD